MIDLINYLDDADVDTSDFRAALNAYKVPPVPLLAPASPPQRRKPGPKGKAANSEAAEPAKTRKSKELDGNTVSQEAPVVQPASAAKNAEQSTQTEAPTE